MNKQQKERLSQFVGITGADTSVATRCLEASGWGVEAAIEIYYSYGMHMQAARGAGGGRLDRWVGRQCEQACSWWSAVGLLGVRCVSGTAVSTSCLVQ